MSTTNYSIPSIIAAYGLGIAPHGYYLVKMMANAKGQSSNILYVDSKYILIFARKPPS
jgi:hypothetical protein